MKFNSFQYEENLVIPETLQQNTRDTLKFRQSETIRQSVIFLGPCLWLWCLLICIKKAHFRVWVKKQNRSNIFLLCSSQFVYVRGRWCRSLVLLRSIPCPHCTAQPPLAHFSLCPYRSHAVCLPCVSRLLLKSWLSLELPVFPRMGKVHKNHLKSHKKYGWGTYGKNHLWDGIRN